MAENIHTVISVELPAIKDIETGLGWQDKQHKELFNKVSHLLAAIEDGRGAKELLEIIDFLDKYVVVHFEEEERAMVDSGFPDTAAHMERHHLFIEDMSKFKESVEATVAPTDLVEIIRTHIVKWLVDHICGIDKELAVHIIKTRGVVVA